MVLQICHTVAASKTAHTAANSQFTHVEPVTRRKPMKNTSTTARIRRE